MKNENSQVIKRIDKRKIKKCKNPNFEMKCIECGQKFYAVRRTAKYCSDYCKNIHAENVKNRIANAKYKVGDIVTICYITPNMDNIKSSRIFDFKILDINGIGYEARRYIEKKEYGKSIMFSFDEMDVYIKNAKMYNKLKTEHDKDVQKNDI